MLSLLIVYECTMLGSFRLFDLDEDGASFTAKNDFLEAACRLATAEDPP